MTKLVTEPLDSVLRRIRGCTLCAASLPHTPRPVVSAGTGARLLIIGQAPGARVHASGIPWQDASGKLLRQWLELDEQVFYNPERVALMPMGFCFPGSGRAGDLPPRPECAPAWHEAISSRLPHVGLTLLIGAYAQRHYLGERAASTLTQNVRRFRDHLPDYLSLPHPSPRNRIWLARNSWFEAEVLPELRRRIRRLFEADSFTCIEKNGVA